MEGGEIDVLSGFFGLPIRSATDDFGRIIITPRDFTANLSLFNSLF
jgi:hypothetical protein